MKIKLISWVNCVRCKFIEPHLKSRAEKNGYTFEEKDVNEATSEEIEWATQLPVIYFWEDRVEYDDALAKIM